MFDEVKHPRGRGGKFRDVLGKLDTDLKTRSGAKVHMRAAKTGSTVAASRKPPVGLRKPPTSSGQQAFEARVAEVQELHDKWAALDRDLLPYAGNPNDPQARRIVNEQMDVVMRLHHIHVDQGGPEGIGMPGGPRDVVIVGAGPAGLQASIYGAAEGLDTLLVDQNTTVGGQAAMSSRIENVLGFPAGVTGKQLAEMGLEQAKRLGAECKLGVRVESVAYDPQTGMKHMKMSDGSTVDARAIVIAGGVQFRHIPFEGSESPDVVYGDSAALKKRVKGGDAVIVGAANSAGQAAVFTARSAKHVTILVRSGSIRDEMSTYLADQLESDPKVTIMNGEIASAQSEHGHMSQITLKDGTKLPAKGVGLFIGSAPNTDWATGVGRESHGFIKTGEGSAQALETDIPGVYAAGDVRDGSVHRVITAAGDGAAAISMVHGFMDEIRHNAIKETTLQEAQQREDAGDRWLRSVYELDLKEPFTGFDGPSSGKLRAGELQEAFREWQHLRTRSGQFRDMEKVTAMMAAKGVDVKRAFAPHSDSQVDDALGTYRMRAAAALLDQHAEIPDAALMLPKEDEERQKLLTRITSGNTARAFKEYSRTPVADLEVLSHIDVKNKPVYGQANTSMATRALTMGSTSAIGDFRHELGHALRAAWSGKGAPYTKTPLTKYAAVQHEAALQRVKDSIAAHNPKPKTEPEWEEKIGVADPRALDSWEEDFAEQYRIYHRALYQASTPSASDFNPDALKRYRVLHPEWARLWDAWYTAQLAGRGGQGGPLLYEAYWDWLEEGLFDKVRHPRGRGGRFRDVLGMLDKEMTGGKYGRPLVHQHARERMGMRSYGLAKPPDRKPSISFFAQPSEFGSPKPDTSRWGMGVVRPAGGRWGGMDDPGRMDDLSVDNAVGKVLSSFPGVTGWHIDGPTKDQDGKNVWAVHIDHEKGHSVAHVSEDGTVTDGGGPSDVPLTGVKPKPETSKPEVPTAAKSALATTPVNYDPADYEHTGDYNVPSHMTPGTIYKGGDGVHYMHQGDAWKGKVKGYTALNLKTNHKKFVPYFAVHGQEYEIHQLKGSGPIKAPEAPTSAAKVHDDLMKSVSSQAASAGAVGSISGKNVVVTGTIPGHTRKEVHAMISAAGGTPHGSIAANTHILVTGEKVGATKINAAKAKGVTVMSWDEFQHLVESELPGDEAKFIQVEARLGEATNPDEIVRLQARHAVLSARLSESPLTAKTRDALPEGVFALPGRRYPIHDESHARNALARVAQHGTPEEKAKVKAAVKRKFPNIGVEEAWSDAARLAARLARKRQQKVITGNLPVFSGLPQSQKWEPGESLPYHMRGHQAGAGESRSAFRDYTTGKTATLPDGSDPLASRTAGSFATGETFHWNGEHYTVTGKDARGVVKVKKVGAGTSHSFNPTMEVRNASEPYHYRGHQAR